jgi:septal ring factor EnvC (AmiA/AmiB activator)
VSYGASVQDFSVKILPTEYRDEYNVPNMTFSNPNAPTLLNSIKKDKMHSVYPPHNDFVYFQGNFSAPDSSIYSPLYTHNSTVRWGDDLEYEYTAFGNEYIVRDGGASFGASVKTLQNGIVAYIGKDEALGNYVIIDHGCGLRTWYTNLSGVDVSVNDIVLIGQHIGKAGKSSVSNSEGFTLYCTIYDTIINPNSLWINYNN